MTLTKKLNITKLHIKSEVKCRFATTEINSRVENVSEKAEEAEFVANLPEDAFITYFEMEIDGKVIIGDVKEKQLAKAHYDAAKIRGETAGHVAQAPRETNKFNISVNIAPYNFARFKLVYQELLQRVRGAYKHQINVHPGHAVDDLQVNVRINESSPLSIIHVPTFAAKLSDKSNKELLLLKEASDVRIEKVSDTEMTVKWHPSAANQTQYLTNDVLDGQLIVLYDVDRNDDQVLVVDGHFIHFLAPKNLDIGSENIVFALDISGSMGGGKLEQTKTAMRSILNQLRETDQFSILCFYAQVEVWKNKPLSATKENISDAIGFIDAQQPRGGTDIDLAVQEGIKWLKGNHSDQLLASILVLLTDGQHNCGQYSDHQITARMLQARKDGGENIKVYGLGFGDDADFNLLREMSTKTGGFARKIYEASDAAIQLDGFYAEISSPLLADLDIKYLNPNVEVVSTVKNITGDTLFEGSEFILIGKMNQLSLNEGEEIFEWHARCCNGPKVFKCCYRPWRPQHSSNKGDISKTAGGFIERSWAYLTVKNLLEKAKVNSEESETLKNQALKLALKYKFVTEQTSMVVTQTEKAVELDQTDHVARSDPYFGLSVPAVDPVDSPGYYTFSPSYSSCSSTYFSCSTMPAIDHIDSSSYNPTSPYCSLKSPSYSPTSPGYSATSPSYSPKSPAGCAGSPSYNPISPRFSPTLSFNSQCSPLYSPKSPAGCATSPSYNPISPGFSPTLSFNSQCSPLYSPKSPAGCAGSPSYSPKSPSYSATSSSYSPKSPSYFPTSPSYSPTSPSYSPHSPMPETYQVNSPSYPATSPSYSGVSVPSSLAYSRIDSASFTWASRGCESGGVSYQDFNAAPLLNSFVVLPMTARATRKHCSSNEKSDAVHQADTFREDGDFEFGADEDADVIGDDLSISMTNLPKRPRVETVKTNIQLNALVVQGEKQLNEMCDDQPPTIIEKLINIPIDSAIAAFTKLKDVQRTTSIDDNLKENLLLSFIAAMVASKLPNSPSEKDLLKSLLKKSSDIISIREVDESQYIVECDAGQFVTVPSILMAIHWKIRLNQLCGIATQNLLIQFLSIVVGTTENGAMEGLAKQVIAALDA